MSRNAYVTLVTSDSYVVGALVLACSLRKSGTENDIVVLVTPSTLSPEACSVLERHFDRVIKVDLLRSKDHANLKLLGREELDVTFTKLHTFNPDVIPYQKVVFLDADALVVKPVDVLFQYVNNPDVVFAAAPDIGWPDCFNSGIFVTRPSTELFQQLLSFAESLGSFDGGDQGLLNAFFSNWSGHAYSGKATAVTSPFNKACARLPFIYNVTPSTVYSYLPAFQFYRDHIHIAHFIGRQKPWSFDRTTSGKAMPKGDTSEVTLGLVDFWWQVFDENKLELSVSALAATHPGGWNFKSMKGGLGGYGSHLGAFGQGSESPHGSGHGSNIAEFANYRVEWNEFELGKHSSKSNSGKIRLQSPVSNATGDDDAEHPTPRLKNGKANESSSFAGFKFGASSKNRDRADSGASQNGQTASSKLTNVFRTSSKSKAPKEQPVGNAASNNSSTSSNSGGFLSGHLFGNKSGSVKVKDKENRKSVIPANGTASTNSSSSSLGNSETDVPSIEKKKKLVNKLKFWK